MPFCDELKHFSLLPILYLRALPLMGIFFQEEDGFFFSFFFVFKKTLLVQYHSHKTHRYTVIWTSHSGEAELLHTKCFILQDIYMMWIFPNIALLMKAFCILCKEVRWVTYHKVWSSFASALWSVQIIIAKKACVIKSLLSNLSDSRVKLSYFSIGNF